MAAGITVRVYTGATAATESTAQTGISFMSVDSAATTTTDRQNAPITVGTRSYEKWLKLKVDTAPANNVTNFKIWGDGAVASSTSLYFTGNIFATGTTPTSVTSTLANVNFNTYTAGNKGNWDAATYSATNATTKFVVFQLAVDADAGPGNWTQETINYSYDET
jgi:hypothetical protein